MDKNLTTDLKGLLSGVADNSLRAADDTDVDNSHRHELARLRRVISSYVKIIEDNPGGLDKETMTWAEKDSVITIIYKLSQVFFRLVAIERKIRGMDEEGLMELADSNDEQLSDEQMNILINYAERQKRAKEPTEQVV